MTGWPGSLEAEERVLRTSFADPSRSPAAVLVVDVRTRQVVHANTIAEQLAPGSALPIDLDAWSDAARLHDLSGADLSETTHSLSWVVEQREPDPTEPPTGQEVSAARQSELGEGRERLWVVAVPMTGAPMLDAHALVVIIPFSRSGDLAGGSDVEADSTSEAAEVATGLRDRALQSTALSFTVVDANDPEQPLIWVNSAFTATTGYTAEESVGHNCRFLQGPETSPEGPALMRRAIEAGRPTRITLLNYRKDGSSFWNEVDLSPVRDVHGHTTHYVGIQMDVTSRVEADEEKQRVLVAERVARADAEAARARLAFLFEVVNRLSDVLDVPGCAHALLDLVVPFLADWAVLFHLDDAEVPTVIGRHRDPRREAEVAGLAERLPGLVEHEQLVQHLLEGARVRVVEDLLGPQGDAIRSAVLTDAATVESVREVTARLAGRESMIVALPGRSRVDDVLVLVREGSRAGFDEDDVTTALDLGHRVGLIMENVRLFQAQSHIAAVLQDSLLPNLPEVTGVPAAARYLASENHAEIGGDFYELLDLGANGVAMAIGDVSGHDILAAAAMGHLRGLLRASAHGHAESPAAVLENVDRLVLGLHAPTMATALFAHAVPDGEGWRLRWSSAGHPPLVLRHPDGSVETTSTLLNDPLLGLKEAERSEHEVLLARGTTVLAYTDGLVERRRRSFDDGTELLLSAVAAAPDDVDGLCEHVVQALAGDVRDDDIALLALTLT